MSNLPDMLDGRRLRRAGFSAKHVGDSSACTDARLHVPAVPPPLCPATVHFNIADDYLEQKKTTTIKHINHITK